jgi:hypothetical protein
MTPIPEPRVAGRAGCWHCQEIGRFIAKAKREERATGVEGWTQTLRLHIALDHDRSVTLQDLH